MNEPRVLRPLGYGELFNEAFDLYKRNFLLFVGIGALVFVPYAFLSAITPEESVWAGLLGLIYFIPSMAATGAVARAIADRYLGKEVTIADAWRFMRGRLSAYLNTTFVAGLMIVGGFFLFIIPGIYLALCFSLLTGVMIVEEKYFRAAWKRCFELAAGEHNRLFIVGLMLALIYGGPGLAMQGLVTGLEQASADGLSSGAWMVLAWALTVLGGLVDAIVQPFASLFEVLVYFDLRVRKEGFDIELLAREMGEPSPSGAPAT
jgi:hypothetical protein